MLAARLAADPGFVIPSVPKYAPPEGLAASVQGDAFSLGFILAEIALQYLHVPQVAPVDPSRCALRGQSRGISGCSGL